MMIPPPQKLTNITGDITDYGLKVLEIEVWYSDVRKIWDKLATLFFSNNDPLREDEKLLKSVENICDKEEEVEENGKGERKDQEEVEGKLKWMATAWGDGSEEECRNKGTVKKIQKEEMTSEVRIQNRKKMRDQIVGRPFHCVALHILHMVGH